MGPWDLESRPLLELVIIRATCSSATSQPYFWSFYYSQHANICPNTLIQKVLIGTDLDIQKTQKILFYPVKPGLVLVHAVIANSEGNHNRMFTKQFTDVKLDVSVID